jgi:hypothetical protein
MSRIKHRYFCSTCQIFFDSPTEFVKDRQKHISRGEINKEHDKSETTTK